MPIRKMTIADIPQVLAIQQELAFQDWNERQFQAEINASYALSVVYESETGNRLLGYAIFHLMGPDSELLSIATTRNAQRKGIGAALLDAGISSLDLKNGDKCFLEVRESNVNARKFYESHGFTQYGSRKKYYSDGENACLYSTDKFSQENQK